MYRALIIRRGTAVVIVVAGELALIDVLLKLPPLDELFNLVL